jgi:hypothetical protein
MIAAFVLACVSSSFAYNVGEYAYNATQRFKVLGENLVQNGNFAQARDGWYGIDKETAPNADVWDFIEGAGPNGENVLQSLGATANEPLCNDWQLQGGGYIVSFDMKYTAAGITSIITAGSDTGNNCMDFFLNGDGSFTKVASTEEAPVTNVATAQNYVADEWKSVVFFFTAEQGQHLVMHFERLAEGFQITNFEIHEAAEVYDVRIIQNRLAFARQLMDDPNFNVDEAQEARANLEGIIATIEEMIAAGEMDDKDYAESTMVNFEDEGLSPYLDATTQNLKKNTYFNYVENLTAFPKYNRGSISEGQVIGGFQFHGGNWLHGQGAAELAKQIQGTYDNGPGSVALYSTVMPAGKYMVSAEVRNAYCDKDYNLTFSLESEVKGFVGSDSVSFDMIKGEDYVRFYLVGEVKEGEDFQAGFWWAGPSTGSRFDIRNFEIRSFTDVESYFDHRTAWNAFIAQWNAATSSREKMMELIGDGNYPWVQDSLNTALAQWDPYRNEVIAKGWINAEGEDAGVATTDELNDWALYQGVELYSEPDEEGNVSRLQYQVVRGYQNATNFVINTNQPFTVLAEAIDAAKQTRNNIAYSTGDRETYKAAILKALNTIKTVRETTSDEKIEADSQVLADALAELNAATEAFIASAELKPFVTIDFSNDFELLTNEDGTENYAIKGEGGQMLFPSDAVDLTHGTDIQGTAGYNWSLGHGEELLDVLRVGSPAASVEVPVEVADNEALSVSLDLWIGYLNKCNTIIELQNAAGQTVTKLLRNNSNGTSETTFGLTADDINKYMTTRGNSSTSNVAIMVDANKTSITMVIDYKNKTQKLTLVNGNAGTFEGAPVALNTDDVETTNEEGETVMAPFDYKVAKLVVSSNYSSQKNNDRRSWLDNVVMSKYPVVELEDDITDSPWANAIETVNVAPVAKRQGIYTLSGQKVEKAVKGLYIINGKKVFVK